MPLNHLKRLHDVVAFAALQEGQQKLGRKLGIQRNLQPAAAASELRRL
jgi:hypothetical protein